MNTFDANKLLLKNVVLKGAPVQLQSSYSPATVQLPSCSIVFQRAKQL